MDDIVKDFLIESNENLDRLDQELVKLESAPSSKELLGSIFRTIHTIKGSCGFLGFAKLEKLAHAGESLLSHLRDGDLQLTQEITSGTARHGGRGPPHAGSDPNSGQDGEETTMLLIEHLASLQNRKAATRRRTRLRSPRHRVSNQAEPPAPLQFRSFRKNWPIQQDWRSAPPARTREGRRSRARPGAAGTGPQALARSWSRKERRSPEDSAGGATGHRRPRIRRPQSKPSASESTCWTG